jgi:hypothetical protein
LEQFTCFNDWEKRKPLPIQKRHYESSWQNWISPGKFDVNLIDRTIPIDDYPPTLLPFWRLFQPRDGGIQFCCSKQATVSDRDAPEKLHLGTCNLRLLFFQHVPVKRIPKSLTNWQHEQADPDGIGKLASFVNSSGQAFLRVQCTIRLYVTFTKDTRENLFPGREIPNWTGQ